MNATTKENVRRVREFVKLAGKATAIEKLVIELADELERVDGVCEWHYDEAHEMIQSCTGDQYGERWRHMIMYCPYCQKRIEVVDE